MRGDDPAVARELRRFFYATTLYALAAAAAVALLARPVLTQFLPKYLPDLRFVYLVMPGVVLFGLTAPFSIVFNVLIRYRFYFYAYGLGTIATVTLLAAYILSGRSFDLAVLSVVKSVVSILMAVVVMIGYRSFVVEHPVFRFGPFATSRSAPT